MCIIRENTKLFQTSYLVSVTLRLPAEVFVDLYV